MRGHIVKRGKDSYSIVLSMGYDPTTGKRLRQWVSVKGNKKEAELKLSELQRQIDTGSFVKPGKITLAEFLERWLTDYARPNLAPRTVEVYEMIARQHLIPKLGNVALTQLKPEHLQRYYTEMLNSGRHDGTGGLSAQSVRHHHTALHKALQTALEWGLLSRNVADAVKPPRPQRTEMNTWEQEDMAKFLDGAKTTPYHALFYTALFTGMRRSELLALRWQDVDFIFGQVYVNRGLHRLKDHSYVFTQPKSAKSRRTVALPPSASLVLQAHREAKEREALMLGKPLPDDALVFCTAEGEPLRPNTISRAWTVLAARCGLKVIRLHDARHTHASLMLKQGIHPKIVQERLGHASIQITLDTYSHVTPGLQAAAAAKFDEGLGLGVQFESEKGVPEKIG